MENRLVVLEKNEEEKNTVGEFFQLSECLIDFWDQSCASLPKFAKDHSSWDVLLCLSRLSTAQFKL